MTEIERAKQEIKEAQEKLKAAQDRLAKAEKKNGWGFWMPVVGERYHCLRDDVDCFKWMDDVADNFYLSENLIAKTKEDANRFMKIKSKLREIAGDVDYGKDLFFMIYSKGKQIVVSCDKVYHIPFGNIVSNDPDFYDKAVAQIGMDDLKWFYSYGWRRV